MLTLGLEVSFSQIRQVGRVGIFGGILQVIITLAAGMGAAALFFHWDLNRCILFGLIISMSSTMVCMKILMDRGELDSMHGRIMMAILILQDMVSVLMIIFTPLLGHSTENVGILLLRTFGGAALFIAIAIVTGLWILPWLMGRVGGVRSRELFLLSVIVLCLGSALGTQIFGLSAVFGAFLVGIVLRETKFVHQALAEVTPLRDIFAALFFVSLGMLLDPIFVYHNWTMVLLMVAIIFFIKFIVVSGIVRAFGYSLSIAVFAGLGLFQIGEFSFIIAQSGMNNNIITSDIYTLVIGSSVITMLITPLAAGLAGRAYTSLARVPLPGKSITVSGTGKPADAGDVIIAGLGRVGQNIAHALDDAGIPFTSVEIDPEVVFRAECKGTVCIYGDASNIHVLSRLDLTKANLIVVTFPDPVAVLTTVKTALSLNPNLRIIARAHRERDVAKLKALGVEELVSPEYEASLEFIRRVLILSGKKGGEIKEAMNRVLQDEDVERFESEDEYRPWM